jgi:hypothetical protein
MQANANTSRLPPRSTSAHAGRFHKGEKMKRLELSIVVILASFVTASALAYPSATVFNNAPVPANVSVNYAACKSDSFTVPARNLVDGVGKATASSNRGGCLITSINATFVGKPWTVTRYTSTGTSFSQFLIGYASGAYKIYNDHDLTSSEWENGKTNDDSPDGPLGNQLTSRQAMSNNPLPKCQDANKSAIAQLEERIAGAPAGKVTAAQRTRWASIRESLKPVPGQTGTIENCNKKTATIASWKAEVDQALGTTH